MASRSIIYADAFFELGGYRYKVSEPESAPSSGTQHPAAFANGWGFVVRVSSCVFYAAGSVPAWFARHFCSRRAYTHMVEVLAQILPLLAAREHLDRHCLLFVDNEPARHALMKGFGRDEQLNRLLQMAWLFIEEASLKPEWQRVCSSVNVADAVSRFDFSMAENQGWKRLDADWDKIFREILELCLAGPLRASEGSLIRAAC